MSTHNCDLCGLSLRFGNFSLQEAGKVYRFCCIGCKQVFRILLEASDSADPADFKNSELFRQCRAMGIIPASEEDLRQRAGASAYPEPADSPVAVPDATGDKNAHRITLQLKITNMWCPACAWVIDQTLMRSPGVDHSGCQFSTDRLRCEYDPVKTSPDRIIAAIAKLGYRASVPGAEDRDQENRREMLRFAISVFLTMNVMMLSFALYTGFFSRLDADSVAKLSWPIFGLATIVLAYGGQSIFKRALFGFFSAAASMETLIAVGSATAYFYSVYNLVLGRIHLYFDTAAMLIVLVLLGKMLERRAKNKIQEDLEHFFALKPAKVRLCTAEFPEGRYVAAEQVGAGDVLRVESGEIVPADGRVIQGRAVIDESSLTGEARPVNIETGNRIRSGSRITEGMLKIEAEEVGDASTLGQMMQIIENALARKTVLEGKTDRLLLWFVPTVLLLAAATAGVCWASGLPPGASILRAVTVMVISCPCALGIAIPLARVAGISLAGNNGILVRDFSAFEQAEAINAVVFDKTGTVTRGQWQLIDVLPAAGRTPDQLLALAAGLEQESDHPVAVEIKRVASRKGLAPAEVTDIRLEGSGISGRHKGAAVGIGSAAYVSEDRGMPTVLDEGPTANAIHSRVFISHDRRIVGTFVFGDSLREGIRAALSNLRERGFRLILVSGDSRVVTGGVAEEIGIPEALGQQLPQEKAAVIEDLKHRGFRVGMVGDGVNDAPAMAAADLAMAVHSGSQLGKEVADATFMRGEPGQILDFLRIAAKTHRKIHQNLWCSFVYNAIAIPVAMSGLLNPLIAVCAMLLSSMTVIGNTLLLVRTGHAPSQILPASSR
jgi:heavy metal translocating P-type ATPase